MTRDIRYIIKRVIIGVLISIILMYIGSLKVKAYTSDVYYSHCGNGNFTSGGCQNTGLLNNNEIALYYTQNNSFGLAFKTDSSKNKQLINGWGSIDLSGSTFYKTYIINVYGNNGSIVPSNVNDVVKRSNLVSSCSVDVLHNSSFFNTQTYNEFNASQFYYECIIEGYTDYIITIVNVNTTSYNKFKGLISSIGWNYDTPASSKDISDLNDSVNNVNDSITSEEAPSTDDVSGNTNDWSSNNAESGVINQLVQMPITLLNSVVNGLTSSCSPYNLGSLFGTDLILPCVNMSNILGSLWTLIDVIISGIFIFIFGGRCVKIFNDFTNLKGGQVEQLYGGGN